MALQATLPFPPHLLPSNIESIQKPSERVTAFVWLARRGFAPGDLAIMSRFGLTNNTAVYLNAKTLTPVDGYHLTLPIDNVPQGILNFVPRFSDSQAAPSSFHHIRQNAQGQIEFTGRRNARSPAPSPNDVIEPSFASIAIPTNSELDALYAGENFSPHGQHVPNASLDVFSEEQLEIIASNRSRSRDAYALAADGDFGRGCGWGDEDEDDANRSQVFSQPDSAAYDIGDDLDSEGRSLTPTQRRHQELDLAEALAGNEAYAGHPMYRKGGVSPKEDHAALWKSVLSPPVASARMRRQVSRASGKKAHPYKGTPKAPTPEGISLSLINKEANSLGLNMNTDLAPVTETTATSPIPVTVPSPADPVPAPTHAASPAPVAFAVQMEDNFVPNSLGSPTESPFTHQGCAEMPAPPNAQVQAGPVVDAYMKGQDVTRGMDCWMQENLNDLLNGEDMEGISDAHQGWSDGSILLALQLVQKLVPTEKLVDWMLSSRNVVDAIDRKRRFTVPSYAMPPPAPKIRPGQDALFGFPPLDAPAPRAPVAFIDPGPRIPVSVPAVKGKGKGKDTRVASPPARALSPETEANLANLRERAALNGRAAFVGPAIPKTTATRVNLEAQAAKPKGPGPRYADIIGTKEPVAPAAKVKGKTADLHAAYRQNAAAGPVPKHVAAKILRTPGPLVPNPKKFKTRSPSPGSYLFCAFGSHIPENERIPSMTVVKKFNEAVLEIVSKDISDSPNEISHEEYEKFCITSAEWNMRGGITLHRSGAHARFAEFAAVALGQIFGLHFSMPEAANTHGVTFPKVPIRINHGDAPISKEFILTEIVNFTGINPNCVDAEKSRFLVARDRMANARTGTFLLLLKSEIIRDSVLNLGYVEIANTRCLISKWAMQNKVYKQCKKCQAIGHFASACRAQRPTCPLCAEKHLLYDHVCKEQGCFVTGRICDHTVLKCVNCGGKHAAYQKQCVESLVVTLSAPGFAAREASKDATS